jgi:hypothetical protein
MNTESRDPATEAAGAARSVWLARADDLRQHLADLRTDTYNGAVTRDEREAVFARGFELLTALAAQVLSDLNEWLLDGTGEVDVWSPRSDLREGLVGWWALSWPAQRASINRFDGTPIAPVRIAAIFPSGWTHGHLVAGSSLGGEAVVGLAWPLQIRDDSEVAQYEPVLRVIAEGEVHDRIFQATHRVIR